MRRASRDMTLISHIYNTYKTAVELRPAQQKDQFTCFTGTKVQILTLRTTAAVDPRRQRRNAGAQRLYLYFCTSNAS